MSNPLFCLIAYKRNGERTCMGHVTDRWDSELSITGELTEAELVARLAVLRADNADPEVEGTWEWHCYEDVAPATNVEWLQAVQIQAAEAEETARRTTQRQERARMLKAAEASALARREQQELARLKAKYEAS